MLSEGWKCYFRDPIFKISWGEYSAGPLRSLCLQHSCKAPFGEWSIKYYNYNYNYTRHEPHPNFFNPSTALQEHSAVNWSELKPTPVDLGASAISIRPTPKGGYFAVYMTGRYDVRILGGLKIYSLGILLGQEICRVFF